ncbi:hypothetical protein HanPSC8_Chr15g0648361 [Helianthus annuus]|nr:hypothetical protein HanPSC8_Chr15g0648361 [Helianthus annuus]
MFSQSERRLLCIFQSFLNRFSTLMLLGNGPVRYYFYRKSR